MKFEKLKMRQCENVKQIYRMVFILQNYFNKYI